MLTLVENKPIESVTADGHRQEHDVKILTPDLVKGWLNIKDLQRDLKVNNRVREGIVQCLRNKGRMFGGPFLLAVWRGKIYLIDGQHRVYIFLKSGLEVGSAHFDTIYYEEPTEEKAFKAMAEEYRRRNVPFVEQKTNDILRVDAWINPHISAISKSCPFVGYSKRSGKADSLVVTMSVVIRSWKSSAPYTPGGCAKNAVDIADKMEEADTKNLIDFLQIAHYAWGRGKENWTLWSGLNFILCMWLYRNTVLNHSRGMPMTKKLFRKCMCALAGDSKYREGLVGNNSKINDVVRPEAYKALSRSCARQLRGENVWLPNPEWANRQV